MSDNQKLVIDEFNKTLSEFINKLIIQFPEETKLKKYNSAYKVTKMYDSSIPIKLYMGGCMKFSEQIKNRDSEFFQKRETFVNAVKQYSSFTNDIGLVDYWTNLNDSSKNAIWDYIQTLYVMGEMYVNKDTTILRNIDNVYNNITKDDFENMSKNESMSSDLISKINN
jgi:hypothetical protein